MAIIKNYLDAELKNTNNSTNNTSAKKPQDTIKPQQQPSILATASIMQNQIRNLAQSSPMLQQSAPTKSIVASASSANKIEPKADLAGPYYDKTTNQIYFKNSVNNSISDASSNLNRYFVNSEAISAPIQANSSASVSTPVVNSTALTTQSNPAPNVAKNAPSAFSVSGSINATPALNKTEPALKKYTLEDYLYKPVEKAAKPAAKVSAKPSPALSSSSSSSNSSTKNTKPALPQILSSPPIAASASSLSPPQLKPNPKSPDPLTTRSELSFKSASSFVSNLDESNEIMPTSTFEQLYFDDSYLFDSMNEATNPLYASSANSIEYNFSPISDRQPSSSSSSSKASPKLDERGKAAHTKSSKSMSPVGSEAKVLDSKDEFNSESLLNEINFESETLSELDIKSDTATPNPDEMKELRSSPALRSSPDLVKSPTGNSEESSRANGPDNEDELSEEEFFNAKNVNLFSFEPLSGGNSEEKSNEPIDQRYKKEYLDPKVFFSQQSRDLPAILENDAELMEEIEMKRLQEELKKEGKSANNYFNGYDEYSESGEDEDEDDEEEDEDDDDDEEETESYEYLY